MRSPGARILVRREEGLRASPGHLLRLGGGDLAGQMEAQQQRGEQDSSPNTKAEGVLAELPSWSCPAQTTQATAPPPFAA